MHLIFSHMSHNFLLLRTISRHLLRIQLTSASPPHPPNRPITTRYPSSISLQLSRLPRRFRLFQDKNGRSRTAGMHLSNAREESLSRYSNILPAYARSRISNILSVSLARRTSRAEFQKEGSTECQHRCKVT